MSHNMITLPAQARHMAAIALMHSRAVASLGLIPWYEVRHDAKMRAWIWSLELSSVDARMATLAMNYLSDEVQHVQ